MDDVRNLIGRVGLDLVVATSWSDVQRLLVDASRHLGASFFAFELQGGLPRPTSLPIALSNFPDELHQHYAHHVTVQVTPQGESDVPTSLCRWQASPRAASDSILCAAARSLNITAGISANDTMGSGLRTALSFCYRGRSFESLDWLVLEPAATLLAGAALAAAAEIIKGSPTLLATAGPSLSASELRCLQLMSRAMTVKEAARTLGVKPRTVHYYLDRAAHKLGVRTRRQAIMKAIADGWVVVGTPNSDPTLGS